MYVARTTQAMADSRSFIPQQAPPNGTNVTTVISNPELGPVGKFLREVGVPYAKQLGGAITFAIALIVLYALGRAFVVPFLNRVSLLCKLTE
jgi:small conductance mechanosensitive channel